MIKLNIFAVRFIALNRNMKLFYKQSFRISRLSEIYRAFRRFTGFKNDAGNAFITKIKEPRVQTQFLVAAQELI